MPGSGGESAVAGEQRRVERFGECDVSGIIGGQVVPQFPNPWQQDVVLVATERKVLKIIERILATSGLDSAGRRVAPQRLGDLEIDQMGRVQRKPLAEQPLINDRSCRRLQQRLEKCRSVYDDHLESRSARTASAGEGTGFLGESRASR